MRNTARVAFLDRVSPASPDESWAAFAKVYESLLVDWLTRHEVQPEDAHGIRQEVMETVYQEIGHFDHRGRPGAFRDWLRTLTSIRLRRTWEKRKAKESEADQVLATLADELADNNSRLSVLWQAEHNRLLMEHLLGDVASRFSEKSIAAYRRITLGEEPAQHVANELGMTLGAVRVAQHRVRKALGEVGRGLID